MLTPAKRDRAILLIHCGVVSEKYRAELRELAEKVCSDGRFAVVVAQNRDEQFRLATPLAPRPASDPLDPRGAPGSGHALGDEADSARGGQGEGEDPVRGMVLLTPPRRRPDPEPTLVVEAGRDAPASRHRARHRRHGPARLRRQGHIVEGADRPLGGPGDPVHIVRTIVPTEAAMISDDRAVAAMGRPRAPCSGLRAPVVDVRE